MSSVNTHTSTIKEQLVKQRKGLKMVKISEKKTVISATFVAMLSLFPLAASSQAAEILTPYQMDTITAGSVQTNRYVGSLSDNEGLNRESGRIKMKIVQDPSSEGAKVFGKLRFFNSRVSLRGKGTFDPNSGTFQFSLKNRRGVTVGNVEGVIYNELVGKGEWNVHSMNVGSGTGYFYLFKK